MSGGRTSRQKGNRAERAIVHLLQERGFAAERVPLSGAARGRFGGDVSVPLLGIDRRVEVKVRGNGFRELYGWLGNHDFLIVKADRREPLVVLRLKFASEIAALAEQTKNFSEVGSAVAQRESARKQTKNSCGTGIRRRTVSGQ
jgi:Holliday junction resolvase